MDANDRSTSGLNDPMPGTPAANAARASLRDDAVGASTHPGTSGPAATADDLRRDDANPGDEIGEAVGGISGVLTGAALGSLGGPIGTVIGGIAGAVSGWWAGRAISEAASHATDDDTDSYYRGEYERQIERRVGSDPVGSEPVASQPIGSQPVGSQSVGAGRSYDDVRPAYQLGHLAGRNPDYRGRSFDEVEGDLRHGWTGDVSARYGTWDQVRDHVRVAYDRSSARYANAGESAGSAISAGASALGAGATYVAGRTGFGTGPAGGTHVGGAEAGMSGAQDRATTTGPLDRAADALDNLKDRVDGNPASRPGPDPTDRRI